jgi:hypothetical protein
MCRCEKQYLLHAYFTLRLFQHAKRGSKVQDLQQVLHASGKRYHMVSLTHSQTSQLEDLLNETISSRLDRNFGTVQVG